MTGCGRTGAGLARVLDTAHHVVTVVDSDPRAFERLGPPSAASRSPESVRPRRAPACRHPGGRRHRRGDGRRRGQRRRFRIAGRIFRVPKVVARLYDRQGAHLPAARCTGRRPVDWGIHRAADLLTFSDVGAIMSLGTGQVDLVEIDLPPLLDGRPISELTAPGESYRSPSAVRQDVHPDNGDDHADRRHRPPRGRRRLARPVRVDARHEVRTQP